MENGPSSRRSQGGSHRKMSAAAAKMSQRTLSLRQHLERVNANSSDTS